MVVKKTIPILPMDVFIARENIPPQIQPSQSHAKARRKLGLDQEKLKVEVTIHYPSGTKSRVVESESDQTLLKAIMRDDSNKAQTIVDTLVKSCPGNVIKGACKVVADESRKLSKKSLLQDSSYEAIRRFSWHLLEEELCKEAPSVLSVISAIVKSPSSDMSKEKLSKRQLLHVLVAASVSLRGRNLQLSNVAYQIGFILKHGGCTRRNIERISKLGVCMSPLSLDIKLKSWEGHLSSRIVELHKVWTDCLESGIAVSPIQKYQLAGDNWDRNILPSYRTTKDKTLSLHLFQVVAVTDRIVTDIPDVSIPQHRVLQNEDFIPSVEDQKKLKKELTFLVATAVVSNIPCLKKVFSSIYPASFQHKYSDQAGQKTEQFPLGLFDCNEKKTKDVIQLMKHLSSLYVPRFGDNVVDQVLFGGDRLTDERVQCAQQAVTNGNTPYKRLEGFISKIEDFHRLMNFLEALSSFSTKSLGDIGTAYYFRNKLNKRDVKGEVKNSYRAYKMLFYTIFDATCSGLLLLKFGLDNWDESSSMLPVNFQEMSKEEKLTWLDEICSSIVNQYMFEDKEDMLHGVRDILLDNEHVEKYWLPDTDDKFHCHFCDKKYANLGSVKTHENTVHSFVLKRTENPAASQCPKDEVYDHLMLHFKLTSLHKNLDTAVDMGDGERVVRSAKYETLIHSQTGKYKYLIGSIQITSLVEEHLTQEQAQRFIWNRFVNISGGKNRNMAVDEYIEMLNRDTKVACTGHQTKESIMAHSREYPLLTDAVKRFDQVTSIKGKKGFHKLPSYQEDVKRVVTELLQNKCLEETGNRKLTCKSLHSDRDVFLSGVKGLPTMISRHKAAMPVRRLRDQRK